MNDKVKSADCSKCQELAKQLDEMAALYESLKTENTKLQVLLKDNGITDGVEKISDTEAICIEQLQMLKRISTSKKFSAEDAKVLDLLHNNLIRARGGKVDDNAGRKAKKLTDAELHSILKVVE